MEDVKRSAERTANLQAVPPKYSAYLDDVVRGIVARGNDAEVRTCREGIKVLEVKKTVAAVIPVDSKT